MKTLLLGALLLTSLTSQAMETINLNTLEAQARLGDVFKVAGESLWQDGGTWSKGRHKDDARARARASVVELCRNINAHQVQIFDYKMSRIKYDGDHIRYIAEATAKCVF